MLYVRLALQLFIKESPRVSTVGVCQSLKYSSINTNILFMNVLKKNKDGWNKCIKSFRWNVMR